MSDAESAEYVDALDHIARVAASTRSNSRRCRWIAMRARCALDGDDWRAMEEKYPRVGDPTPNAKRVAALQQEVEQLRQSLHEICEEWAGAECGEPVYAQEAYAIGLARRMYALAAEALKEGK